MNYIRGTETLDHHRARTLPVDPNAPGLTQEQFHAELLTRFNFDAARWRAERENPPLSESDVAHALVDFLRLSRGRTVRNPHPLANQWHRDRLNLAQVQERAVAGAGSTGSDFSDLVAASLQIVLQRSYATATRDLSKVLTTVEVPDFREHEFISLSVADVPEIAEDGELPRLSVSLISNPTTARIREYSGFFRMSRKLWSTAGSALTDAMQKYAEGFLNVEGSLLATALSTSNAIQTVSNSGALNSTGMGLASAKLRRAAENSGNYGNWPIGAVIVPPELEAAARGMKITGWGQDLAIVVLPWLSAANVWYAVAPPEQSGGISRLQLRGGSSPSIVFAKPTADAAKAYCVQLDTNIVLSNPLAICKVT